MKKLKDSLPSAFEGMSAEGRAEIAKAQRVQYVRAMWCSLVEPVFLEHTNGVFVFDKEGKREMHVYVDDSLFASELNNRRELLKLQCRERFGETIDVFSIHISKGRHKDTHPFVVDKDEEEISEPLSPEELQRVEEACENIPASPLRDSFRRAMISDLEWKKGQKR